MRFETLFQFFLETFLEFVSGFAEMDGSLDRFGEEELETQEEHEEEAYEFHGGFDIAAIEEGGEAGKGDETINHFHDRRAQADEHGPFEAATRAFVHDRDIYRPDRD